MKEKQNCWEYKECGFYQMVREEMDAKFMQSLQLMKRMNGK